jgi:hypothetical protein
LPCQPAAGAVAQNVILVTSENDWFYIFTLWSDDPSDANIADSTRRLVKGIATISRADRAR